MARTLEELEPIVRNVLTENAPTRDNDKLLYYTVLKKLGYDTAVPLGDYLRGCTDYPNYDSITRCRRKIQEHDETLIGNRKVRALRKANQETYIEYAVGRLFEPDDEVEE